MPIMLEDKEIKNSLTIINRVARPIFNVYTVSDRFVFPASSGDVKEFIFEAGFFKIQNGYFDFLENQAVYPEIVTKALNDKAFYGDYKDNGWVMEGKSDKWRISDLNTREPVEKKAGRIEFYRRLINMVEDGEYSYYAELSASQKSALLNYESVSIPIENAEGDSISLSITVKFLPAIKQANCIKFYAKPFPNGGDNVFEIVSVSCTEDWRFYSRHYILNY